MQIDRLLFSDAQLGLRSPPETFRLIISQRGPLIPINTGIIEEIR